jgi:S1-C subfamily serine protease
MTRILSSLFILMFISSCVSTNTVNKDKPIPPTESFVKVIKILSVTECEKENTCKLGDFASTGSGISLGTLGPDSLILTAGHVCSSNKRILSNLGKVKSHNYRMEVRDIFGKTYHSDVLSISLESTTQTDLCMLLVKGANIKGVIVSEEGLTKGDRIYNIASPFGVFHPPVVPILEGTYSGDIPNSNASLVTLPAIGGSSGSPIFNEDMRLVGILFATHPYFNVITLTSNYEITLKFIHNCFVKVLSSP